MEVEFLDYGVDPDPQPREAGKTTSQQSDYVSFRVSGVDNSFANGLRRVMLAEIPTLAITTVEITINTSVLHDEFITNRIGLVPLKSPFHELVDAMPMPQECECGQQWLEQGNVSYRPGCDNCQIRCEFDVMCPPDQEGAEFTSADFRSSDPRFKVAVGENSKVYLAKLGRGQRIRGVAYAKKGIAKQHARHMPVGTVSYRYDAEINLNHTGLSELTDELRTIWISRCPAKVFALVDGIVTMPRAEHCIMCRECLSVEAPLNDLPAPLVSVRNKRDRKGCYSVVMRVESVGMMPAVEIVRVALVILKRKLAAIQVGLQKGRGSVAVSSDSAGGGPSSSSGAGGSSKDGQQAAAAVASSVVVGQQLLESEQDLLHMAEKMW